MKEAIKMWIIWAYAEKKEDLEKEWQESHRTHKAEKHDIIRLIQGTQLHGEDMEYALIYEVIE
jgi:hypothetical protein